VLIGFTFPSTIPDLGEMREARLLLAVVAALAVGACARQPQTSYVIDPNTGQPVPVMMQPQFAQADPAQPPSSGGRGLFSSQSFSAQQSYAAAPEQSSGRGLFNMRSSAPVYAQQPYPQQAYPQQAYAPPPQTYAAPPPQINGQQSYAQQRYAAQFAQPQPMAAPQYAQQGGPYAAAPYAYASAPANASPAYTLDSGDKLRVVVFGQDGISNSYIVDAGGNISLPLVGIIPARGYSTQQLSAMIAERLKQGYVREPHVSVEVEAYRPFFILGEVTNPGQYPYVANMTAETAIAIAGGFAPRASKSKVELTRNAAGQQMHGDVPLGFALRPGDTVVVKERWF
jgi:polysaccharide export outer membrane protein